MRQFAVVVAPGIAGCHQGPGVRRRRLLILPTKWRRRTQRSAAHTSLSPLLRSDVFLVPLCSGHFFVLGVLTLWGHDAVGTMRRMTDLLSYFRGGQEIQRRRHYLITESQRHRETRVN